ncbi:MAG: hypothetical protein ACRDRK_06080 [Pseudonocardia sp.]
MRATYRVMAFLIVGLVMVQAAAIVFADFGFNEWIDQGGVLDKATMEAAMESGEIPFAGVYGYIIHGLAGQFLIPLVALVLLVVSFFAKVPKGVLLAGIVFGLIVLQVVLALSGIPALGALHGINALAIFAMAMVAASRAKSPSLDAPIGVSAGAR